MSIANDTSFSGSNFFGLLSDADAGEIYDLVHTQCVGRRVLIATAESCTSGLIAAELGSRSGSSAFLYGAWVVYSNHAKHRLLNVSPYDIRDFGAVSEEVARDLLRGVFEQSPTTHAIAVTGIAGPTGGSAEKPVGTVWIGVATRGKRDTSNLAQRTSVDNGSEGSVQTARAIVRRFQFDGNRDAVRNAALKRAGLILLEVFAAEDNRIDTLSVL